MKTRDYQWVLSGGRAFSELIQQGYLVTKRQNRRGVKWCYMMKEFDVEDIAGAGTARHYQPGEAIDPPREIAPVPRRSALD